MVRLLTAVLLLYYLSHFVDAPKSLVQPPPPPPIDSTTTSDNGIVIDPNGVPHP